MNFRFLSIVLVAFLAAGPALADNNRTIECTNFLALAATSDDTVLAIAPEGGAKVLAVSCQGDADITTPPVISFEDSAGNAVTHGTLTCAENGANASWVPTTAANNFVKGEGIVFDVDNASTTAVEVVCVLLETKD